MSKRFLAVLLVLAVLLSSIALPVYAEEPAEQTLRIEAEDFEKTRAFPESGATDRGFKKGTGAFGSGDALEWASYPNVNLGAGYRKLRVCLAAPNIPASAQIEFWLDAEEELSEDVPTDGEITGGTLLGSFKPVSTGGYQNYQVQEFEIDPDIAKGTLTLYFLIRANNDA